MTIESLRLFARRGAPQFAAIIPRVNALELLADLTRRQVDSLFEAVRQIPADKLDWKPAPGARSALDQLQELATVFSGVPGAVKSRKLDMSPDDFAKYQQERAKLTDPADLEQRIRAQAATMIDFILTIEPEELDDKVEMPWPGDFRVSGMLSYCYWNMSYHEGQIYYISTLLAG